MNSPFAGVQKCVMYNATKCLNDKPNIVLTEQENHSKENEFNHSKENDRLMIPNESSNRSNSDGTRDNTQLKPQNCASWVSAVEWRYDGPATNARWGIPKGLGLRGGGENSLNTGTSGWGTPPAGGGSGWGTNPPPQNQWGANRPPGQPASTNPQGSDFNQPNKSNNNPQQGPSQNQNNAQQSQQQNSGNSQPPASSQGQNQPGGSQPNTSWAQAAGKGLPSSNQNQSSTQTSATKQLEQLNTMREALFSQDGWGGQHVNQDTSWDIPGSPEPGGVKSDPQAAGGQAGAGASAAAAPMWKPNVNNGTDLWEANLRNGGQPPPTPQNKTPWGHTPSTNIGGTWGEEDENSDSSNVWTGVPPNNPNNPWPGPNNAANWPAGPEKKAEWTGGAPGAGGTAWSDPRPGMDPRQVAVDPSNMNRDMMHGGVMRGDQRGVSGRLNTSEMWAVQQQQQQQQQPQQPQQQQPPNKMGPNVPPAGANQWTGTLPKDMTGMPGNPPKPSGWEEPSPPAQRRNIPNYDDGTSLWGQQHARGGMQPPGDLPPGNMGRGNMPCPPGMPQNRMPGAGANMKPDNPVWGHPARNGAWDTHESGPPVGGGWGDENKGPTGNWAGEQPLTSPSWPYGGPTKPTKGPGWGEEIVDSSWGHPSMQRQQMPNKFSKDLIWGSKPFRILSEMNFKKEDVENALRTTNMSLQDALEILTAGRVSESWNRRQEEHSLDQSGAFSRGFNPNQQVSFPPGGPGNVANNPAAAGLLNNLTNNPGLAQMNNMKLLSQQLPAAQQQSNQLNQGQQRPGASQPSPQQLKMLVNQIQMAVQAGYLNHQILNRPLCPQTLLLLNQLLQQIKILQQLNQQHTVMTIGGQLGKNSSAALQLSVQITKIKQSITNYQNQIAAEQARYMKQQGLLPQGDPQVDLFKTDFTDPLNAIQSNFSDLSLNKEPSQPSFQSQQQSRLNQWKLPSLDKDNEGNEFSRAPGTTSKSSLPQSHSSPNINPLLGQTDATWSAVSRSNSDTGWPDSTTNDNDSKDSQWSTSQPPANAFADIIPEFEPGKPWKGTQIKSVEDDPSMTPGSVARSPLSLATIKDTEILSSNSKSSPPATSTGETIPPLSLSSSPWTFNPTSSSVYTSPLSKLTSSKPWGEAPPAVPATSELWLAPGVNKARGPPPGLSTKVPQSNWGTTAGSRSSWGSTPSGWGSSWLLLRNLTPQIDGSTLKTLCLQHGPLQNFHLYLNHGIAFAKYSSREEANKAQTALNNCVLGNTTIFAESPGESEVATMLNSLGHQPQAGPQTGSQNWNLRGQAPPSKQPSVSDTWAAGGGGSNLWQPNPSGSTLWGSDGDSHRTTPSASLNSFLPPDLLNGESM